MKDFLCYYVTKEGRGPAHAEVTRRSLGELPDGEVLIKVAYSSLNYKDALSATGHPGVTRRFPHVPGIDASGTVVESRSDQWSAGDEVLVTSYDLGQNTWGGLAEYIRVPAAWVVKLPSGLSLREAMILGTAGFTAGMGLDALTQHGIAPARGEIVVSGASGGVGSLAVAILAKAGYRVVASTGKSDSHDLLRRLGAAEIIGREQLVDESDKPLLAARWAGAIDTVGGKTLATILRSAQQGACITACGLVGGIELPITVYPFILRGVDLAGIDSAECPRERRLRVWQKLASDWKPGDLEQFVTESNLSQLGGHIQEILKGRVTGRVLVKPAA